MQGRLSVLQHRVRIAAALEHREPTLHEYRNVLARHRHGLAENGGHFAMQGL